MTTTTATGADYVGLRTVLQHYASSFEDVRKAVADGQLHVFATAAGQQFFRLSDVERTFKPTSTEQENTI